MKIKTKGALVGCVIIVVLGVLIKLESKSSNPVLLQNPTSGESSSPSSDITQTPAVQDLADTARITLIPESEQVLDEVKRNPHEAPESLVQYAGSIGRKMQAAQNDRAKAEALVTELEQCAERARSDQTQLTLEVFCLEQASKLSNKYQDLAAAVKRSIQEASPRARQILQLVQKNK